MNKSQAMFPLYAASLFVLAISPFIGASWIKPLAIFDSANPDNLIFWALRLPRSLGAFLAGASLAVCGAVFQAMFRNPLATPYTLGVSAGAAFGASVYFRFFNIAGLAGFGSLGAAFGGCALSMLFVYALTSLRRGLSIYAMLLAGVIINFFFSSLVLFIQYLSHAQDALQIMRWLMGSLAGITLKSLWALAFAAVLSFAVFYKISAELDLLYAGEEIAASRGVAIAGLKLLVFAVASLAVGIIVSITGPIGFVGMMVPQLCRILLGYAHERILPAAFFGGGAFLCLCDVFGRVLLFPVELPIGILTAMLGAPFFLWILLRRKGNLITY